MPTADQTTALTGSDYVLAVAAWNTRRPPRWRRLLDRIRRRWHHHDPIECWCELNPTDAPKEHRNMPDTASQPTGSDYVRAVAQALIARDVAIDMTAADLDEEQCNLPIANFDEIVWLRWLDDPEHGWHFDDEHGRRCAPICAPDTPVDEAARILARYI